MFFFCLLLSRHLVVARQGLHTRLVRSTNQTLNFFYHFSTKSDFSLSGSFAKNRGHFHLNDCTYISVYLTIQHCQRHNGSEGWVHITSPTQILIKLQFRNLDKALNLKSQLNINISSKLKLKILTKPSFIILTKIQLRNLNQTSAADQTLLQNFAWTSTSNSWPNLVLKVWTKV